MYTSVTHTVLQHFSYNIVYLEVLIHKSFRPTEIFYLRVFTPVYSIKSVPQRTVIMTYMLS